MNLTSMRKGYGLAAAGALLFALLLLLPSHVWAAGSVIDNRDAGYSETGAWTTSGLTGQYGSDSRYASSGSGSSKARWTPDLSEAGQYDVYIWYPAYSNRATDAPLSIAYDGGTSSMTMDQTANGSQWNLLGTFDFAVGTAGYVELTNDADGYVGADAIAFVPEGDLPPLSKLRTLPASFEPGDIQLQTLFDADPLGVDAYLAFPTIERISDESVIVSYKRGDAHYMESEASLETMIYNPSTGSVSRTVTDHSPGVINQNPELIPMPNGDLYNFVDQQDGGTKNRLGVEMFKSTDDGVTFSDEGKFPQVGAYEYGYFFDGYNDGGTMYVLAMSFPELTGGSRAVHVLKTEDSGATWSYVKNLNMEFGFAFNESSLEKYGSGYLIMTRGDDHTTKLFRTDAAFNLVSELNLSAAYEEIDYIGRPKLFVKDGDYYLLCRNIEGSVTHLKLYKLNPDTLALETSVEIDSNTFSASDSYYAESYFIEKSGVMYLDIITYQKGSSSDKPNIVRYEIAWKDMLWRLQEDFDGTAAGAVPSGWTEGTAGGDVGTIMLTGAPDKSLKLEDTSSSQLVEVVSDFEAKDGTTTLALNALAGQTTGVFGISLRSGSGVNGVTVAFDGNGDIYTYDGGIKTVIYSSYNANAWYGLKLVADMAAQTFDIYIDNVKVGDQLAFRHAVTELSNIRLNSTGAGQGIALMDDIVIY
ncbi:hypothetical protein [Paenibacillus sp. HB172176]|uniref:golvesin C-terminal-like domain-containing protein n=1 Tax=Paenibacillus sp. HB172176 TaxID=2493690 RepID=UPI001439DB7B|nr:hypothetical protein [Paenibacillus sp. HB172176]